MFGSRRNGSHQLSSLRRWLDRSAALVGYDRRKRRPLSFRPTLEALEERWLPTGHWTEITAPTSPGAVGTMILLSDGRVMALDPGGPQSGWSILTPDAIGSYVNGTWSRTDMGTPRDAFASNVLPNGNVFVYGGEYSTNGDTITLENSGVIYNPATNTWKPTATIPGSLDPQNIFGDEPSEILPNGDILASYKHGPQTFLYNPQTDSWSAGPTRLYEDPPPFNGDRLDVLHSNEETWVKLPDGSVLSYDIWTDFKQGDVGPPYISLPGDAQRYVPSLNKWIGAGTVPVALSAPRIMPTDGGGEIGPALLLPDGRVFQVGAYQGNTALYTPSTNTWVAGPTIPGGYVADDAPGAILPDGNVIFTADAGNYQSPTKIFEFDPIANSITPLALPAGLASQLGSAFETGMLVLPTGEVLFGNAAGFSLWTYSESALPDPSWRPTISGITSSDGITYTLAGTQLTGISEGASYGDDAGLSSNYPLVQITDANGVVSYARSFNWSSTGVAGGNMLQTTQFTPAAGIGPAPWQVKVIANGIPSAGYKLNPGSLVVTTLSDAVSHGGTSLRDAITLANSYAKNGISAGITFAPPLAGGTITLSQGQLELSGHPLSGSATISIDASALPGGIMVSAGHASRIFQVDAGVQSTILGLTLRQGNAGLGGGINNDGALTVFNSTITGNSAQQGGGINNEGVGALTIIDSTIAANAATNGYGGGIASLFGCTLLASNSTFTGNSASSTVVGFGNGGGIYNAGQATLRSCTISVNTAGGTGGGVFGHGNTAATLTMDNTIVAGNLAANSPDLSGPVVNGSETNLVGDGTGVSGISNGDAFHNKVGSSMTPINPLLSALGSFGGPTQTMPLQFGSPAIGAATPDPMIATDQRGVSRPLKGPDIGAYQTSGLSVVVNPFPYGEWTVNASGYFQSFSASGGTGTWLYAVTAGALPSGLALSSDGLLSGTPLSAGAYTFTVTATDAVGGSESQSYTVTIHPPVSLGITTLLSFTGLNGSGPAGDLLKINGNLFGTTSSGGPPSTMGPTSGTVFELNESTGMLTTLATFTGPNGAGPAGGLVADAMGDLFGTTVHGGASGAGTVFEIPYNPTSAGYGPLMSLASFDGTTEGGNPYGTLAEDSAGNFYGTTSSGGTDGLGTVFQISRTTAGGWSITTITSFDGTHGAVPLAGVIVGPNRSLYGTTSQGGAFLGQGTVFMVPFTTAGTYGPLTTVASFSGPNGAFPQAPLTLDSSGNLFGTTFMGGVDGDGTAFEVPSGSGTILDLASFDGAHGALPGGDLTFDSNGNLYGTTLDGGADGDGTIFQVPAGSNVATHPPQPCIVATFSGPDGANPSAGVLVDSNGNLWGTTFDGGASNDGTVFQQTNTLASGTTDAPYTQTLEAVGGTGTLTFSSTADLPPGLVLSGNGMLSGTPTVAGTYSFAVTATDAVGSFDTHLYTLTIFHPPVPWLPAVLPNWTMNQPGYSQQLSTTGGDVPYTFSVSAGALPSGLSLNPSTGLLSGTPTATGMFSFTITVTDSLGNSASRGSTVTINPPITIGAGYPPGTVGQSYSFALAPAVSGGTGAYTFTATGILAPGLALGANGTLAGIPKIAGTYSFQLTVTDSVGATDTVTMLVTIYPALMFTTGSLPYGEVDCPYNTTIQTSGGSPPITFTLSNGALPPGLMMNSGGVISGIPTTAGNYTFTVTATDSVGASSSQIYNLFISPMLAITTTKLVDWTVGVPGYVQNIHTSGGTIPITFSVSAGSMPTGLDLATLAGEIFGTPVAPGTFSFTITATDSSGCSASQNYTVEINPAPSLTPLPLPNGMAGIFYDQQLSATGGTGPVTFYVFPGTMPLPPGLFLSTSGALMGTPTVVGTFTIPVLVMDSVGASATQNYMVTISPGIPVAVHFIPPGPTITPTGVTMAPVSVQIVDAYGDPVTTDSVDNVTITAVGPGGFTAGSTTTTMLQTGAATFSNLTPVVPGTYTLAAEVQSLGLIGFSNGFNVVPLQVLPMSFVGSPSGFSLQFNAPYLVNSTTPVLYGVGFGSSAPVPSVTLTQTKDASGNPVHIPVVGSLILSTATNSITFLATDTTLEANNNSPALPDGTYTAVLHSSAATDGFQALSAGGGFLDGLGTGVPGSGDYTKTFMVNVRTAADDVVWAPDTGDGPGEFLNAPGNNKMGGGYPLYLDAPVGTPAVTGVVATLNYDPNLLTVSGATGAGFTLLATSTPGHARVQYSGPALAAGSKTPIGFLTAQVPSGSVSNPVPYKMKDLLHLSGVSLNGGTIGAATADALHLVAYVGDGDGNGSYSNNDAVLITRVLVNADAGFAAYPLVDPVIVADTDGDGFMPADAALQVAEASVGLPTMNLPGPPIPAGVVFTPIPNNVDPTINVPSHLQVAADGTVAVPVNLDDPHPAGSTGLIRAELALTYNPALFTVSAADVHLGSLLAAAGGWSVVTNIDQATGQIGIALSSDTPITTTSSGSLVIVDFHSAGPIFAPSSIDLVASARPNGEFAATELEDMQGAFTLTPASSNGPDAGAPLSAASVDAFFQYLGSGVDSYPACAAQTSFRRRAPQQGALISLRDARQSR
jgi:uncharacterized repeat protein (TIGR03803 family)